MRISDWSSDVCSSDLAAELRLHRLLPVTDAEQRDARIEDRLRDARATLVDHRRGAAREDDATGSHPFEGFLGRVERRDLAVDAGLADAAGRSEERRVGKEGVRTGGERWVPDP